MLQYIMIYHRQTENNIYPEIQTLKKKSPVNTSARIFYGFYSLEGAFKPIFLHSLIELLNF